MGDNVYTLLAIIVPSFLICVSTIVAAYLQNKTHKEVKTTNGRTIASLVEDISEAVPLVKDVEKVSE